MPFDLHAYLARIGFTGATQPTLTTLQQLHHAHVCSIPFENIDVLLNRPVHLETEAIQEKLVTARRGAAATAMNIMRCSCWRCSRWASMRAGWPPVW